MLVSAIGKINNLKATTAMTEYKFGNNTNYNVSQTLDVNKIKSNNKITKLNILV